MVDTGATSHIIMDIAKFKKFDNRFKAETHCMELADATRCNRVVGHRVLLDRQQRETPLHDAETSIVHPLISAGHLFCKSSYCQQSDRDLQARERYPTTQ